MIKTEIYYFSGTGSSLHIARELQKRIPGTKVLPIVSFLHQEYIELQSQTVGLVFPIYLNSTPIPVREFIRKIRIKSDKFIFAVTTNCGYPGRVDLYLEKLLKERGKNLDAYYTIKMLSNSPKGLLPSFMIKQNWASTITKEVISSLEKEVQKELDIISKFIIGEEKNIGKDRPNPESTLYKKLYLLLHSPLQWNAEHTKNEIGFYIDSTCTGCRICERVCPSNKIKMDTGKPLWQKEVHCYYCYACFNFCPEQAILVKNYSHKNGRYVYPGVSAIDIAAQKNRGEIH